MLYRDLKETKTNLESILQVIRKLSGLRIKSLILISFLIK